MKKNYRFLSSIALTGMLATSIMGTTVNAATPSVDVVGVCSNVLSNKIVPVVVKNGADSVKVADLAGKFEVVSVNGTVANNATVVKTGDKFKVKDGAEYTVVVYGDANKDGVVDVFDATYIQDNVFNGFNGEAKVAADVARNSEVDTFDALRIQEYVGGVHTQVVDNPHTADSTTPVVTDSNYTIKVNENGYINNQNKAKTSIEIKLTKTYDEAKNLKIKLIDKNKKVISADSASDSDSDLNVTIPANTDKYVLSDKTGETPKGSDTSVDVTNLANGEITIELHETVKGKDTIVGTGTATKNVADVKAAKISASRPSATTAALSLEGYGENKIVTVEYTNINGDNTVRKIENVNDKLDNKALDFVFPEGATTMKVTLVDEYGNKSTQSTINIPAHGAKAVNPVETVTAPDLTKTATAAFAITTANGANVTSGEAILYTENGKIVDSKPITNSDANNITFTLNKAGKYKVGVIVNGDGSSTINSEEKYSELVEVKELNKVTDVKFSVDKNNTKVISWADSNDINNVDTTTTNNTEYTFSFEEFDEDEGYVPASPAPTATYVLDTTNHTASASISGLKPCVIYKVTITTNAKQGQGKWIVSSNPTVSDPFFYIDASNLLGSLTSRTDSSLTYALANPITVNGTEATYKAEVNKVLKDANQQDYTLDNNKETKNAVVTTDKSGNKFLTIEGLDNNQRYVVKIIANVGDVQGESNLIGYTAGSYASAPQTYATTPKIDGYKIVKSSDTTKAVAKTVFVNGSTVILNGDVTNPITVGVANNNYTPEFNAILTLTQNLLDNDVITVNNNESVSLELTKDESSSTNVMNLTNAYEGLEINVKGTGVESDRKMTIDSGAKLAKVAIGGNGLILNVTNSDADTKVYLNNGAEVTGNGTSYILVAGATATINGITANTTSADMSITATGNKVLQVNTPKGSINTNLTFTNNNNGRYAAADVATINFKGVDTTSEIKGTVTINSENGSVKVTSPTDNTLDSTKLNLVIDVKNADADVTGFVDSASVNVKVVTTDKNEKPTVVKAYLKELPKLTAVEKDERLSDKVLEIKDYSKDEKIVLVNKNNPSNKVELTGDDKKVMQEFINGLGIEVEGATIYFKSKLSDDKSYYVTTGEVEIEFPAKTNMSQVNLSGFATYEAE